MPFFITPPMSLHEVVTALDEREFDKIHPDMKMKSWNVVPDMQSSISNIVGMYRIIIEAEMKYDSGNRLPGGM